MSQKSVSQTTICTTPQLLEAITNLTPTQLEMLHTLSRMGHAVSLLEIADFTGLHPNSARETLDTLAAQGIVHRASRPREGRGRPAWVYQVEVPRDFTAVHQRMTDLLSSTAEVFALHTENSEELAISLGKRWAENYLNNSSIPIQERFSVKALTAWDEHQDIVTKETGDKLPPHGGALKKITAELNMHAQDLDAFNALRREHHFSPHRPGRKPGGLVCDPLAVYASKFRVLLAAQGFRIRAGEKPSEIAILGCPYPASNEIVNNLIVTIHISMLTHLLTLLSGGLLEAVVVERNDDTWFQVDINVINK